MNIAELEELSKKPTKSIGTLPFSNYFDIVNGYKEALIEWNYFYQEELDLKNAIEGINKKVVDIPYMGELHGFGSPAYTNDRYLFPYLPPYMIKNTSAQVFYRKENIKLENKEYILQVEGVDNSYYLFVNKRFVGFSNITHCVQKFDINKYLIDGENEIRLVVLKFSPSSYLEDQDKIRLSGIIRNIYLVKRNKDYLENYKVETDIVDAKGIVKIHASKSIKATLSLDGFKETKSGSEFEFVVDNPLLWNAETPYLYDLDIECNGELIHDYVGIRKVEVKGNLFLLNGKLIKMRGVNRHSFSMNGNGETHELMEKDIELMRKMNINAVRTSHYPADPYFYYLCDKYGIYVISEADLETHGTVRKNNAYEMDIWDEVISNPVFYDQLVEREISNVIINGNHPSVVVFSLGNESGFGEVINKLGEEIKKIDNRPLHYEGAYRNIDGKGFFKEHVLDMYSRMYPPIEYCYTEVPKMDRPFVLCEFIHAMGNSLGEAKDYIDAFWKVDNFFGAFVWEWLNQYIVKDGIECYGGDFGEEIHDAEFCVDGLVYPDRLTNGEKSLTPQIYELRECYSPVEYELKDGLVYVKNRYDFINLKNHVFKIDILKDGVIVDSYEKTVDCKSKETVQLIKSPNADENHFVSISISLFNNDKILISKKSLVLEPVCEFKLPRSESNITYELDKECLLKSIKINSVELFKNMKFNLSRAYVSNDRNFRPLFDSLRIRNAKFYPVEKKENNNSFEVLGYLGVEAFTPFYKMSIKYSLENEELIIKIHAEKMMKFEGPLRFGIKMELPDGYGPIEYLGLEGESYSDRHEGNPFGLYSVEVKNNERYVVPQNANDHFGTVYLKLKDDNVVVKSNNKFSFCYDCFDICDYKAHRNEMPLTSKRYLFLDYKMRGVGTSACGPVVNEKHQVNDDVFDFCLHIFSNK